MFDIKVKPNGKIDGLWYKNQYEKLWKENNFLEHEKDILNKRIEKAVEYIENDDNFWVALGEDCGKPNDDLDKLLNILNDKE